MTENDAGKRIIGGVFFLVLGLLLLLYIQSLSYLFSFQIYFVLVSIIIFLIIIAGIILW